MEDIAEAQLVFLYVFCNFIFGIIFHFGSALDNVAKHKNQLSEFMWTNTNMVYPIY